MTLDQKSAKSGNRTKNEQIRKGAETMKKAELIYTGGGIYLAIKPLTDTTYAVVSNDFNGCISVYDSTNEDYEYACQNMIESYSEADLLTLAPQNNYINNSHFQELLDTYYKLFELLENEEEAFKADFVDSLERLKDDFLSLAELWETKFDGADPRLTANYPFDKSFDEVAIDVVNWLDSVRG